MKPTQTAQNRLKVLQTSTCPAAKAASFVSVSTVYGEPPCIKVSLEVEGQLHHFELSLRDGERWAYRMFERFGAHVCLLTEADFERGSEEREVSPQC